MLYSGARISRNFSEGRSPGKYSKLSQGLTPPPSAGTPLNTFMYSISRYIRTILCTLLSTEEKEGKKTKEEEEEKLKVSSEEERKRKEKRKRVGSNEEKERKVRKTRERIQSRVFLLCVRAYFRPFPPSVIVS